MILIQVLFFALVYSVAVRGANEYGKACSDQEPCTPFCPHGWKSNGKHCFMWSQDLDYKPMIWEDSEVYCRTFGAHLASVTTSDVYDYLRAKISKDTWIGATNQTENGTWVWTDCSSFTGAQPQESGSCAHLKADGGGSNEKKCGDKLQFVCKALCPEPGATLGSANDNTNDISRVPRIKDPRCNSCVEEHSCQGWEKLSGGSHCYILVHYKKTWFEAEQLCNGHGGHLASVTNQEIHNYINRKNAPVWVGGTDEGTEGNWRWSDCSTWSFEQWKVSIFGPTVVVQQPDNGIGFGFDGLTSMQPENCLQMRYNNDYKWHDVKCSDRQQFVCSKKLCPTTTSTVTTTITWTTTTEKDISNLADKNSTNVTSTSDQGDTSQSKNSTLTIAIACVSSALFIAFLVLLVICLVKFKKVRDFKREPKVDINDTYGTYDITGEMSDYTTVHYKLRGVIGKKSFFFFNWLAFTHFWSNFDEIFCAGVKPQIFCKKIFFFKYYTKICHFFNKT